MAATGPIRSPWRRWATRSLVTGHRLPVLKEEDCWHTPPLPRPPLWSTSDHLVRGYVTELFSPALTEPASDGIMTDCVAYAEPPATVPSTVSHRRQRDQRLRSFSQPDRLGRGRWGAVAQGVEGRDDSP